MFIVFELVIKFCGVDLSEIAANRRLDDALCFRLVSRGAKRLVDYFLYCRFGLNLDSTFEDFQNIYQQTYPLTNLKKEYLNFWLFEYLYLDSKEENEDYYIFKFSKQGIKA